MRKIIYSLVVLFALAFTVYAQIKPQFNFGVTGNRTTNNNDIYFGAFAEVEATLPNHFGFVARVDASRDEALSTLWTRDNNPEREAKGSIEVQGDFKYTFNAYSNVAPFATFGFRALRHLNLSKPNSTFNPSVGGGATLFKVHRAAFTGIIRSPFENKPKTGLTGYEVNYRFTKQIGESRFSIFAGTRLQRFKFRETAGGAVFNFNQDYYSEYDNNTSIEVGIGIR